MLQYLLPNNSSLGAKQHTAHHQCNFRPRGAREAACCVSAYGVCSRRPTTSIVSRPPQEATPHQDLHPSSQEYNHVRERGVCPCCRRTGPRCIRAASSCNIDLPKQQCARNTAKAAGMVSWRYPRTSRNYWPGTLRFCQHVCQGVAKP